MWHIHACGIHHTERSKFLLKLKALLLNINPKNLRVMLFYKIVFTRDAVQSADRSFVEWIMQYKLIVSSLQILDFTFILQEEG